MQTKHEYRARKKLLESVISAAVSENSWQKSDADTVAWFYGAEKHAKKSVERYLECFKKKTSSETKSPHHICMMR